MFLFVRHTLCASQFQRDCMCAASHVCVCFVCVCVCVWMCVCVCVCLYVCVCLFVFISGWAVRSCVDDCVCISVFTHTHASVCELTKGKRRCRLRHKRSVKCV